MDSDTFFDSFDFRIDDVKGVSTSPGATTFTRIPFGPYVAAADNPKPIIPALAAAIASWFLNTHIRNPGTFGLFDNNFVAALQGLEHGLVGLFLSVILVFSDHPVTDFI